MTRARTSLLLILLLAGGCAALNGGNAAPAPRLSARNEAARRCPDRIDRTGTGGTVGTVVGTIVGSFLGMPFLGGLYQVGGYVAGLASADPCAKVNPNPPAGANAPAPRPVAHKVSPPAASPLVIPRDPPVIYSSRITEENLP